MSSIPVEFEITNSTTLEMGNGTFLPALAGNFELTGGRFIEANIIVRSKYPNREQAAARAEELFKSL